MFGFISLLLSNLDKTSETPCPLQYFSSFFPPKESVTKAHVFPDELIKYRTPYAKYKQMGPKCVHALTTLNKKKSWGLKMIR